MVMSNKVLAYEESRQKRLEENKKRMEELNLNKLAQALRTSPKPSPMKKTKPRAKQPVELTAVRRSSRVADKPAPNYKEMGLETLRIGRRRLDAIQRAEDLEAGLDNQFPSFIKPMLQSHVTGGFWLGLPVQFCKAHLPKHDEMITLVDENGDESDTKYLAMKTGLSGGWRGFALDHELVDGDALVFQLIEPTRFKASES
nr:B3 domain-containing protein At3g19184-like [Ipomoea batatas]